MDSSDQIFAWDLPFERFFYRKGIEKGIFYERFWKKNGAQQLPYVTFSLNCIILAISLSQGGQERYISAWILRKQLYEKGTLQQL